MVLAGALASTHAWLKSVRSDNLCPWSSPARATVRTTLLPPEASAATIALTARTEVRGVKPPISSSGGPSNPAPPGPLDLARVSVLSPTPVVGAVRATPAVESRFPGRLRRLLLR